jgi:hypothetical protein
LIPRALGADKFGRNKPVYGGGSKRNRAFYVPEEMRRRDVTMLLDERWIPKPERSFAAVNPFDPEKWAVPAREVSAHCSVTALLFYPRRRGGLMEMKQTNKH